jgi:TM2 domain-containing membrane protein YozV
MAQVFRYLPELRGMESAYVQHLFNDLDDEKAQYFSMIYRSRRRDPTIILITTLVGFFGVAGIQRFLTGQIGLGLIYLFTAGLCFIGTIVDLVKHEDIAFEYNRTVADQALQIVKSSK